MLETLKMLCSLSAPSGCEDEVREYIIEQIKNFATEIKTDSIGNLLVFKKGKHTPKQKIMIAAHMDEVGFIIKKINDDGSIKFGFVGGIDPRVVIGKRVLLGKNKVRGVVGIKAVHLTSREERKTMPKTDELYIDIGAGSKKAAESLVSLGDFGVFDSKICEFGDGFLKAKALDDRIGCAIMIELIKSHLHFDLNFAFTVQEEVGLRGATIASYNINPDICLVLEGTTAADLENVKAHKKVCALRCGAVVPFMDRGTIYSKRFFEKLRKIANENNIKWQTKELIAGGTDGGKIHLSQTGVETTAISLPIRYIHSPSSVCAIEDINAVLNLATLLLKEIGNE